MSSSSNATRITKSMKEGETVWKRIKSRKFHLHNVQLSMKHRAIKMKFLLVCVVFLVGSTLAVPLTRHRRDILPGDPRYGTDYHHHHHNHAHDDNSYHQHGAHYHPSGNQVQLVKATGQYAGGYQLPAQVYGPPGYQPGRPIHTPVYQPSTHVHHEVKQQAPAALYGPPAAVYGPPATVYGPPATVYGPPQHEHHHAVPQTTQVKPPKLSRPVDSYGVPVNTQVHHHNHESVQTVNQPSNTYLTAVVENRKPTATVPHSTYEKPKLNNQYLAPVVNQQQTSPAITYVPSVQRSHVTVEAVPGTLQQTYTETVRDEAVQPTLPVQPPVSFPSFPTGTIPSFPTSIPNFGITDFTNPQQIFSDAISTFGDNFNYDNFVSSVNNNGFNFGGFGSDAADSVTEVETEKQNLNYKQVPVSVQSDTTVVENPQHHHHGNQPQKVETSQPVGSNGGYVY